MIVIDATDAILGRLASRVAKKLLKGEKIVIVNAEKAVVTGNPRKTFSVYLHKRHRGDRYKGPFYPRYPDKLVRRVIRGMLPYKKPKGKAALSRLKVYIGCPSEFKTKDKISKTSAELRCKYTTVKEICKFMGAKL